MSEYYVAGGTLHPESPCYVERDADRDLYENLLKGEFCYVLTSRQMGKSSLMARTAWKLKKRGFEVVMVDLTAVGQNVSHEQWYDGLIMQIGEQLDLEDEIEDFWEEQSRLSSIQRFVRTLTHVVLEAIPRNLIIFIDEIDVVQSLPFSADELFGAIRECYNRRTREPKFQRLDFCLLGVASPVDLVSDASISPFNSGVAIELRDFDLQETEDLAQGLNDEKGMLWNISHQIFHWTQGHPYLTLRLYRAMAFLPTIHGTGDVDDQCQQLFLQSDSLGTDPNLVFVNQWLLRSEIDEVRNDVLKLVEKLALRNDVPFVEGNPVHRHLLISGFGIIKKGQLVGRNPIYEQAFNASWVRRHFRKPASKPSPAVHTLTKTKGSVPGPLLVAGCLLLFGLLAFGLWKNNRGNRDFDQDVSNSNGVSDPALEVGAGGDVLVEVASDSEQMALARSIWAMGGGVETTAGFFDASYKEPSIPGEIRGVNFDDRLTLPAPDAFGKLPNRHLIKTIRFEHSPLTNEHFKAITTWTNIEIISIPHTQVNLEGLKLFKQFPKLGAINIHHATTEVVEVVADGIPGLRDLSLEETTITPGMFAPLSESLFLSHINFFGFQFQGCGFETLKDISSLQSVRFADSKSKYVPMESISHLTQVIGLDFQMLPLRRQDFQRLAELETMQELSLGREVLHRPEDLRLLINGSLKRLKLFWMDTPAPILNELKQSMDVYVEER